MTSIALTAMGIALITQKKAHRSPLSSFDTYIIAKVIYFSQSVQLETVWPSTEVSSGSFESLRHLCARLSLLLRIFRRGPLAFRLVD